MRIRLTIRDLDDVDHDIEISAANGARLAAITPQLAALTEPTISCETPLWSGSRQLSPDSALGGPGMRNGDIVNLARTPDADRAWIAVPHLRVAGGPHAAQHLALRRGDTTIGRDQANALQICDPRVSRHHARLVLSATGATIHDLDSTNGTTVEGSNVTARGASISAGDYIRMGDSTLYLQTTHEPAAQAHQQPDGTLVVNRAPERSTPPERDIADSIGAAQPMPPEPPPTRHGQFSWQWLAAALLPALAGVGLAVAIHNRELLIFALLGPLTLLLSAAATFVAGHRGRRRSSAQRRAAAQATALAVIDALRAETRQRRRANPDPSEIMVIASTPGARIWERRRTDPHLLEIRLGLADSPARQVARSPSSSHQRCVLSDVPATIRLREGPLGIGGPPDVVAGVARSIVAQLATMQSPQDLALAVILSDECGPSWTWLRWLPHLDGRVADTAARRGTLIESLLGELDARLTEHGRQAPQAWTGPWTVVLVDRVGALPELAAISRIFSDGYRVGISAICLDRDRASLPGSCATIASVTGELGSLLRMEPVNAESTLGDVCADQLSRPRAEQIARALAPLAPAADTSGGLPIPRDCRLLDLLELGEVTAERLRGRWRDGDGAPITALGVGTDGPVVLDLARDGPHVLIAGTTGAGKSELLQTLVAGLAANNSPADLAFVLIDYKGGAAFAGCAELPHTAALITDLDGQLTERALRSLNAELRRREALLAATGAPDLAAYRRGPGQRRARLGRLLLVVDEFAALAEEFPELLRGLVAIAQRGRSLGFHLVLATQRPTGVVSPEIQANLALRICLRVTDAADSAAVVGTDLAARIPMTSPGRALVRSGVTTVEMQTARIGVSARDRADVARVRALDEWGRPAAPVPNDRAAEADLSTLVRATCAAATAERFTLPAKPWCPPLPDRLSLADLAAATARGEVAIGLTDLPDEQRQDVLTVDLDTGTSMLFAGAPRSGRSSALLTLARSAATCFGPNRLHVHVIDCGAGALSAVATLAHVRTYLTDDDPAAIARLVARLRGEEALRHADQQPDLAGRVRSPAPYLLVLLDGWERFVAACDNYDGGATVDSMRDLLRAPPAARLTIAATGGRSSLSPQLTGAMTQIFAMRFADAGDYALLGISRSAIPRVISPGRAVLAGTATPVQLALSCEREDTGRDPVASKTALRAQQQDDQRSIVIRPLPDLVRCKDLLTAQAQAPAGHIVLGVGGDAAERVTVDLFDGAAQWLVAGPPRSGRSELLASILVQARATGCDIVVVAARRSPLAGAAQHAGITVAGPNDTFPAITAGERRLLVLVDDSATFADSSIDTALCELIHSAGASLAMVVCANSEDLAISYRGIAAAVRRARTGVLLHPSPGEGALLGVRLPRVRASTPAGRGVLVTEQPHLRAMLRGEPALAIQLARAPADQPICG